MGNRKNLNPPMPIKLCPFPEDALSAIVGWRSDSDVNRYIRRGHRTLTEISEWYRDYFSASVNRLMAVCREAELIGYCTIEKMNVEERNCEVGLLIGAKKCWRQGIGGAALRELLRIVFADFRMHRVEARIHADNVASISCFSRAGFRLEGRLRDAKSKDGSYVDLLLYSILEGEWAGLPGIRTNEPKQSSDSTASVGTSAAGQPRAPASAASHL